LDIHIKPEGEFLVATPPLSKIVSFVEDIGISFRFSTLDEKTFLPGLLIYQGSLVIEPEKLKYPGDILHEAGHIAITKLNDRPQLTGDVHKCGHGPAEEMAAIAWSWAASRHVPLSSEILFHSNGYKGASKSYIEAFETNQGFGYPLLVFWGLTKFPGQPDGFPRMLEWLRV
jgi:hypothetical protein